MAPPPRPLGVGLLGGDVVVVVDVQLAREAAAGGVGRRQAELGLERRGGGAVAVAVAGVVVGDGLVEEELLAQGLYLVV